jgi:hypothetical protein
MRILPCFPLALATAGCLYPHPPPPPPPTEALRPAANCADAVFPTNPRVAAWSVDKFAGHYRRGELALTVTRDNHRGPVSARARSARTRSKAGNGTMPAASSIVSPCRPTDLAPGSASPTQAAPSATGSAAAINSVLRRR